MERDNYYRFITAFSFLALVIILVGRFAVLLTHFFDPDEFVHLYRGFLLSENQIPYRDFGLYAFTPLFHIFIAPFFILFKESLIPIFLSKSLIFIIFLFDLLTVYFIGLFSFGNRFGLLAAFILAFFPFVFCHFNEIRPDNLAILFWLVSFLFLLLAERKKSHPKFIFLSGLLFGLSLLVVIKTFFAYPALLACLWLVLHQKLAKKTRGFFIFHLGLILPWLIWAIYFSLRGLLGEAVYWTLLAPQETNRIMLASKTTGGFAPFSIFTPNDVRYGFRGSSLPWILSNIILALGLVGLVKSVKRLIVSKDHAPIYPFLFFSFLGFSLVIFFYYNYTSGGHYYLPLAPIMALAFAAFWQKLENLILKKTKAILLMSWIGTLLILSFGYLMMIRSFLTTSYWRNTWELELISNTLTASKPGDRVFDMVGRHLFREQGYFFCCELFPVFGQQLSRPMPDFQNELVRTQTQFVINGFRLNYLNDQDRRFLEENYFPSGIKDILVAGKKVDFSSEKPVTFYLIVDGCYQAIKPPASHVWIDEEEVKDVVCLKNGNHFARGENSQSVFLLYDYRNR